jgi:hypothetical protein
VSVARPLRILFFLLHPGYLRHYRSVIELLADRGHTVQLAFTTAEQDAADARLQKDVAGKREQITAVRAPARPRRDGWRGLAGLSRSLADVSRYADPRYANASQLRARGVGTITERIHGARMIDPLTRRLGLGIVRFASTRNSALAARCLDRVFTEIEAAIPTSRAVDSFIDDVRPDVVLASPLIDFGSSQVEYLKSAARLGIPHAVCVASWDNLTGKGLIRVCPDRVFVWNDTQRREAVEQHRIPPGRVVATGAPKFDEWFVRRPRFTPGEFRERVGLPAEREYLLYLCSSSFIAPDEVELVTDWLERLRADDRLARLGVLIRPHPQNSRQWAAVDLSRFEPVSIWPRRGAQPDAGEARDDFFDSLAHSAAVVGLNTSALIESAILGKSVFTVLDPRFAGSQRGTLHYHYLRTEDGGFLHEAATWGDHLEQLSRAVAAAGEKDADALAFVERFVRPHGLDRPATPILADAIEDLAAMGATSAPRPPIRSHLVRVLLLPAVLLARLVTTTRGATDAAERC